MKQSLLLSFTALSLLFSPQANAQSQFPEFMLSPNFTVQEPEIIEEDRVSIRLQNNLMRDTLILQEQINLLESLVERQAEIQNIAENYAELGIPYRQPPPPINVCKSLPSNVLCLFFYPELENNQSLLEEARQRTIEKQQEALMDSLAELQVMNSNFSENDLPSGMIPLMAMQPRYAWADIQCLKSECTALVVSENDTGNRQRVSVGDMVDNTLKITSITPLGIKAMIDDETIDIQPLAVDGSMIEITEASPVSDVLAANQPVFEAPVNEALDLPFGGEVESSDETNEPNLLGPTGLF